MERYGRAAALLRAPARGGAICKDDHVRESEGSLTFTQARCAPFIAAVIFAGPINAKEPFPHIISSHSEEQQRRWYAAWQHGFASHATAILASTHR